MKRLLLLAAGLVACTPAPVKPPEPTDPVLQVETGAMRALYAVSFHMPVELSMCGIGTIKGDSALVRTWTLPDQYVTLHNVFSIGPCPPWTVAMWHLHVLQEGNPEDMCYLSSMDITMALQRNYPWQLVTVGQADTSSVVLCWWHLSQIPRKSFPDRLYSDTAQRLRFTVEF